MNYKKFKIEKLDSISPTFCAAKWIAPNFYLYAGTTSSCQLPEPGPIDISSLKHDINNIDSTVEKIEQRRLMLQGKRPDKCANCWQVEDAGDDSVIPERVLYSHHGSDHYDFTKFVPEESVSPYTVTVAFDTLCNFTCSYCDPSQSSSWYTDIKKNGIYYGIKQDPRYTYQKLGTKDKLNEVDYKIVFEKFCEYIEQNILTLVNITCLGGEPLVSPNFWKFIDRIIKLDTSKITLTVITNLSDSDKVKKILSYQKYFKSIDISASIENIGKKSEFVRQGLVWETFNKNINFLLENNIKIRLLATIPGIALDGFIEFLNWYKSNSDSMALEVHRLRHPVFQAPQVLPQQIKDRYATDLSNWIVLNSKGLDPYLVEQLKNIVTILKKECIIYNNIDIQVLQKNAQAFYKEFAKRHNYNIKEVFSQDLADWILS